MPKRSPTAAGQLSLFDFNSVTKIAETLPVQTKSPVVRKLAKAVKTIKAAVARITYSTEKTIAEVSDDNLYQNYAPQNLAVPNAKAHPAPLVESIAMASVVPPTPSYQPLLPVQLIESGRISHPQIEAVIRAGEAHSKYLNRWVKKFEEGKTYYQTYTYPHPGSTRQRMGFCLGDGTGTGKTTIALGIILDNFNSGRSKAVVISKNTNLYPDFCKTWIELGGKQEDLFDLGKLALDKTILRRRGILFTTYGTIRGKTDKDEVKKTTRIDQICNWLGEDFSGVIAFDESHEMANAIAAKTNRGEGKASRQGLAGIEIQNRLPDARIVYLSATIAENVRNLGYLERLGLWQDASMPFDSRNDFIAKIEKGGIAAMEIVCRDLKASGVYMARSLSFAGVEYNTVVHELTPQQTELYSQYARAYQAIHEKLTDRFANRDGRGGYLDARTKSDFERSKQEFFKHLITAMKVPTLITEMERDLAAGRCPIVQIVSTNEASLDRHLDRVPINEYSDVQIDLTPRELIIEYLQHAYPVYVYEEIEQNGKKVWQIATDSKGEALVNRQAQRDRDALISQILRLDPIGTALDQIIDHFGTELVAEVTGRSQRLIRYTSEGVEKMRVDERKPSSNLLETNAFQDGKKQILIFSDAGKVGASYHADLTRANTRTRVHYLLEPGFSATKAIQGLGRAHRSNQKQPPIIKLLTTNVYGEKRFISTIARRLASLGALTKGHADTGNSQLFSQDDDLESLYGRKALNNLLDDIFYDFVPGFNTNSFYRETGILLGEDGTRLNKKITMKVFLNRLLAMQIDRQNQLFRELESRVVQNIELAKEAGIYETGVEFIKAESLKVIDSQILWTEPKTNSETIAHKIQRQDRRKILSTKNILQIVERQSGELVWNSQSGNVAAAVEAMGITDKKTGRTRRRVKLIFTSSYSYHDLEDYSQSSWQEISELEFSRLWQQKVDEEPEFEISEFYLLTGMLLPIWDSIGEYDSSVKVWRVLTDSGENLLGRVVSHVKMTQLYRRFNKHVEQTAANLLNIVDSSKEYPQINNTWRLKKSTVAGSPRYEVIGWKYSQIDMLVHYGCFEESIHHRIRVFIPYSQAVRVLERLKTAL